MCDCVGKTFNSLETVSSDRPRAVDSTRAVGEDLDDCHTAGDSHVHLWVWTVRECSTVPGMPKMLLVAS